ncbi:hypothetical protein STANM309S_02064 [Streptomyces tanashiensis]
MISTTPAPVSACAVRSTSRIWAWTVTSRAVVGSSATMTDGAFAMARAMTTRWRIPPENSCGNDRALCRGSGMPTRSSSSTARFHAARFVRSWCTRSASERSRPTE